MLVRPPAMGIQPRRLEGPVPSNNPKTPYEISCTPLDPRGFGFFLQDFGPRLSLSRAASAPSLRPVIAKNGDTDVQVRLHVGAQTPIAIQRAFFMPAVLVMAAVRGRSFGVCRGPICPVLHTCARLPPSFACKRKRAASITYRSCKSWSNLPPIHLSSP